MSDRSVIRAAVVRHAEITRGVGFIYHRDVRRPFATLATAYVRRGGIPYAFTVIIPKERAQDQRTFRDEFESVASSMLFRIDFGDRFEALTVEANAIEIPFRELCIEAERHGFHDWEQP